jgi:hypothetical protein
MKRRRFLHKLVAVPGLLAGLVPAPGFPQNLIPNPGFEDTLQCPFFVSQIDFAAGWHTSVNTPDYYHACNNTGPVNPGMVGVPVSARGYQPARTGFAFAGQVNYWTQQPDYRETFYAQLTAPLAAGIAYNAGLFVILNEDNAQWAVDGGLGLYFSAAPINPLTPFNYVPQVANPAGNVLNDSLFWTEISGTFTASGGEQYVTIGSFIRDTALTVVNRGGTYPFTSYAIDDVWVVADSLVGVPESTGAAGFSIRPNPNRGRFRIEMLAPVPGQAVVEIRDPAGRLLQAAQRNLRTGSNAWPVNIEKSGPGLYVVIVRWPGGRCTGKVMVH